MTPPRTDAFVWRPEDHRWTAASHVARFIASHRLATITDLRERAAADTEWFWREALADIGLEWARPFDRIRDMSAGFPWTKWFVGGRINVTHNCIDRHVRDGHGGEPALFYEADSGRPEDRRALTFAELKALVDRIAGAMHASGAKAGDCIALYAPMRVETVAAFFAAMKIGARTVPIFAGYGEQAVAERLQLCRATILFASDRLFRRGKSVDTGTVARAAAAKAPTVRRVVMMDVPAEWDAFLAEGDPVEYAHDTAAEDPCLLIYTSGTTGRPKGTVHTHAGCLAQTGKELRYAFDVHAGEPFFWLTDIGWMMGPWELIGALMYRAPVVLFDGAPNWPDSDRLYEVLERLRVVTFGISPTAVRMLMRATDGRGPAAFDLSRLRVLGSTGEPWDEASYLWFHEHVGRRACPIINISGGTEIIGCHLQPYPVEPLKPCSLGGGALGMDVDVFDDEGRPLRGGQVGYLVCKKPAPSMTKSFLDEDERYIETYFSRFPNVWYHGDWASVDADGHWFLHGRADDTIKVAGKRVGPAEVESVLISHPTVSEAATIGVDDDLKGQALVCFVVAKPGQHPDEAQLKAHVAEQMGKPLAPKRVHAVAALPKTRSGKIVRGTIRRAYLGQPLGDLTSVDNPEALAAIQSLHASPPH
jgi:acetyl-CoA synthetase